MKSKKKWSNAPVQTPVGKAVWDKFDEEAARDANAIQQANAMRVKRPKRVK